MRLQILLAIVLFPLTASAQFPFNIGSESLDQGFAIAASPGWSSHFIVVAGEFRQSADFDPGPDEHILTANGTRDAFVASYTRHGDLRWAFNVGGPGVDGAHGVAIDEDENVYVVGTFRQTADFDPGDDEYLLTSNGETDAFLASFTADGAFRWAFNIGGENFDQGHAITVTDFGAVCATGSFRETVDFDPGPGETTFTSAGSYNIWVACYTADSGDLTWAYGTGGPGNFDRGWGIDARDGAVYVTGDFTGTAQFDPAGETEPLTALGLNDIFVVSYTDQGAYRWAHRAGSTSNEIGNRGNGIAVGLYGDEYVVYVTGDFVGQADFPGGHIVTSAGGRDGFVAALGVDGAPRWVHPFGGPGDERGTDIDVIGQLDAQIAVMTAYFEDSFELEPGKTVTSPGQRSFLLASFYDDEVTAYVIDHYVVGGPLNDQAYGVAGTEVDVAYATGSFRQTVDFPFGNELTATGPLDVFVARFGFAVPPFPSIEPGAGNRLVPSLRLAGPNPSVGGTAVVVTPAASEHVVVEVFDVLGRRITTAFDGPLVADQEQRIFIPDLPAGIYVVRARGAAGGASLRISPIGR